ncbi:MAG: glycosyltransferase family 2 protein [Proteobacteria bacterium]|nr:glycosyltransferase family 2 protein [Pseudomonadota bacterium]MBU1740067.1 glycosyltransferase family 2 protein [Pseudomonadota bacterium]
MDASFVIPAYNHHAQVWDVVSQVSRFGRPVFVVDDGSDPPLGELPKHMPQVKLLRHPENRGKGAALMTGFRAAAEVGSWAITLDADGQHLVPDAKKLMEAVAPGQRALVVGRRTMMDLPNVPWTSQWGRRFSNFWVRMAGGPAVLDSQSGFRLYPLPETIELGVRSRRFQFEVEVLVLAAWHGLPVTEAEVGVFYQPPENRVSHFRPGLDFWRNTRTFSRLIAKRLWLCLTCQGRESRQIGRG